MDINRNAQIIVDLTIVIDAPLTTVWNLHTAIDQWPTWQNDITEARLSGPVATGSSFTWLTHGLSIESTIGEVDPTRRIAWGGPAHGIEGVHVWTFEQTPQGVLVRTSESWDGPPVAADPEAMRGALVSSLTAWLAALKSSAEAAD
jgi:uncharacterized protein YndB with AHSA1/START domain